MGEVTQAVAAGALEAGMDPRAVRHLGEVDVAARELEDLIAPGDVVLVKGSRAMGLEAIVDRLVAAFTEDSPEAGEGGNG